MYNLLWASSSHKAGRHSWVNSSQAAPSLQHMGNLWAFRKSCNWTIRRVGRPCWENAVPQSRKGPASPVEVKATLRPNSIWQTVPSRNQWEAGHRVVILCLFTQENNSSWSEKRFYKKLYSILWHHSLHCSFLYFD